MANEYSYSVEEEIIHLTPEQRASIEVTNDYVFRCQTSPPNLLNFYENRPSPMQGGAPILGFFPLAAWERGISQ